MNRFIKYLFGLVLALTLNACTDWVDPAIPYNEFDTGLYLRTLNRPSANFNFFNLDAGVFEVTVEAVDIEDGRTLREVEVFVSRRRGPNVTPEARLGTIPASAFQPHSFTLPQVHPASGSKFPAATIRFTLEAALTAMGMTKADINGGDFIEYRLAATDTQGRVFTNTNLSPDIVGGLYYRSPFFYRYPIVCPSALAGEYIATTTGTSTDGCCPDETTVTGTIVTLTATTGTSYRVSDWSAGLYREWYEIYGITEAFVAGGGMNGIISDACGIISGSFPEPFQTTTTVTGSVDAATGVITYTWVNGYDDQATVILTPR